MIIIYEQKNKPVAIINLAEGFPMEDAIKQVPDGAKFRIVDEVDLPSDTDLFEFADALLINFDSSSKLNARIDIEKAREITKSRLRKERAPLFENVDLAIRDAMIENDQEKLKTAVSERNRLRDLTNLVYTATTVEELRNLTA